MSVYYLQEIKLSFSDKLKWLKNLIPDNASKGSDTVSVLEDAAKYVRSLQRKREVTCLSFDSSCSLVQPNTYILLKTYMADF